MGMSAHVVGFRKADERWRKMKAAWDSCEEAKVEPPTEVLSYFDGEKPGDKPGVEVDLGDACRDYQDHSIGREGYEIDVEKLPDGVSTIRMFNDW